MVTPLTDGVFSRESREFCIYIIAQPEFGRCKKLVMAAIGENGSVVVDLMGSKNCVMIVL